MRLGDFGSGCEVRGARGEGRGARVRFATWRRGDLETWRLGDVVMGFSFAEATEDVERFEVDDLTIQQFNKKSKIFLFNNSRIT